MSANSSKDQSAFFLSAGQAAMLRKSAPELCNNLVDAAARLQACRNVARERTMWELLAEAFDVVGDYQQALDARFRITALKPLNQILRGDVIDAAYAWAYEHLEHVQAAAAKRLEQRRDKKSRTSNFAAAHYAQAATLYLQEVRPLMKQAAGKQTQTAFFRQHAPLFSVSKPKAVVQPEEVEEAREAADLRRREKKARQHKTVEKTVLAGEQLAGTDLLRQYRERERAEENARAERHRQGREAQKALEADLLKDVA